LPFALPFSTLVLDFCPIFTPNCPTTKFLLTLYLAKVMIKLYSKKEVMLGDIRYI